MRIVLILLLGLMARACGDTRPAVQAPSPAPGPVITQAAPTPEPESKAVTELRAEAKQRGIRWRISCHGTNDIYYIAWGVPADSEFANYIEDGAKPGWFDGDFATQDLAAAWLTKAIRGQPNNYPKHKPAEKPRQDYCNSTIRGEVDQ